MCDSCICIDLLGKPIESCGFHVSYKLYEEVSLEKTCNVHFITNPVEWAIICCIKLNVATSSILARQGNIGFSQRMSYKLNGE